MIRKNDVAILDYDMGNLFSVSCALNFVGLKSVITDDAEIINKTKCIIIPGVGAYPEAMKRLKDKGLDKIIYDFHEKKRVIIGICLGMQLLFSESSEIKKTKGLGLLEGNVEKFKFKSNKNTFNVGWSQISTNKFKQNNSYVTSLNKKKMYFIHSYYVNTKKNEIKTSTSKFFEKEFISSVKKNNIQGFQFHPEKSGADGIEIYRNLKKDLKNL
jgi:imidazole glycerol-phosphate synthase subunit HisH